MRPLAFLSLMLLAPVFVAAQSFTLSPEVAQLFTQNNQLQASSTSSVSSQIQSVLPLNVATQQYIDVLNPGSGNTQAIISTLEQLLLKPLFTPALLPTGSSTATSTNPNPNQSLINALLAQVMVLQAQIDAIIAERAATATSSVPITPTSASTTALTAVSTTTSVESIPYPVVIPEPIPLVVPSNNGVVACPVIHRVLMYGSSGNDVTNLQLFLADTGLLEMSSVTGFFGKLTEAALQTWQREKQIVSEGTPATTGYGATGPKTRAALQNCR